MDISRNVKENSRNYKAVRVEIIELELTVFGFAFLWRLLSVQAFVSWAVFGLKIDGIYQKWTPAKCRSSERFDMYRFICIASYLCC